MSVNSARFLTICRELAMSPRNPESIGTYMEKRLHLALKKYLEPRDDRREIKFKGYIADILNEDGVTEIQTSNFGAMKEKLRAFTEDTPVRVVYPVAETRTLTWIEPDTGVVQSKRKSPKRGSIYMILPQMVYILDLLAEPRLRLSVALLDVDEYRLLTGRSRDRKRWGARKYESVPVGLRDIVEIDADFANLIPASLTGEFTIREFGAATGLGYGEAQTSVKVLRTVGAITQTGKRSRQNLYARATEASDAANGEKIVENA